MNIREITKTEYEQMLREQNNPGELSTVHVRQEKVQWAMKMEGGVQVPVRVSQPIIQKYTVREWGSTPTEGEQAFLRSHGYEYEVLYTPTAPRKADGEVPTDAIEPDEVPLSAIGGTASGRGKKKNL